MPKWEEGLSPKHKLSSQVPVIPNPLRVLDDEYGDLLPKASEVLLTSYRERQLRLLVSKRDDYINKFKFQLELKSSLKKYLPALLAIVLTLEIIDDIEDGFVDNIELLATVVLISIQTILWSKGLQIKRQNRFLLAKYNHDLDQAIQRLRIILKHDADQKTAKQESDFDILNMIMKD